ncbi:MAG: TVP38/TMEM64 family protein [Chloroflexi bacterium]|nr:TVP38/TMEM64 family protein [Chloroflexota bacterium]
MSRRLALIVILLALASFVLSVTTERLLGRFIDLSPEAVRAWVRSFGAMGPVVFVLALAAATVVAPVPSVPFGLAGGLAFGIWWGTLYSLLGAQLGALACFFLARRFGRLLVARYVPGETLERLDAFATRSGARAVFVMRLVPAFNFDWVSYVAGLTPMRWQAFAIATAAGMAPPVFALVAAGDALATDVRRALGLGVLLLAVAGVPLAWWLLRGERHAE